MTIYKNSPRIRSTLVLLAALPLGMAWAGSPGPNDPHRGGKLRLMSTAGAGTIDPHINYTLQFAQIFQGVYDGLVAFKKAPDAQAFTIVPDLAEALPAPENGGKRYVFKLRRGIKFSDGRELTANDVAASFRRIFKVSGPTAGSFYNGIVGADACLKTPASCTLAGGVVADAKAGTVTLNLVAPDAEIFYKLAVPHAFIVPADAPAKDVGVNPLPGTGAYKIVSYDPKKQLKLLRNPQFKPWSDEAQPDGYVDEVDYDFGLNDEDQVTAIANGQGDWMFNPLPADRLGELSSKYAKQLHVSPLTAMFYLPMNTRIAPFNNLQARQAVNLAIDRNALVKIYGGSNLATASCQVLPPQFAGYEAYCPYTKNPGSKWTAPDLARAKDLVKASGTAGQKVTLLTEDTAVGKQIGTYVLSVLNDLGYQASLKVLALGVEFTYIQNTQNKVQISYSNWYQDYPAPSNFLNVLFSCGSFHEGSDASINISGLCDKGLDADLNKAMSVGVTDPAAAAKLWAAIDRKVTDLAPVAVMFNPKQLDFVSKRVGGYQFSGQFYFLWNQAWVR
ncbi:ABC transporter substrate-binding protein [Ideonella azotifigens]|uniref:ABC transporter substrate-binding protein n=1 Tax=Ideonella azotifigens TaxID=513160 RepID=A0ABN1KJF5_9BURK|nr:ABC transporter substrate-binding protein [Ideonella azotifigens]MCD2339407.1 ABC transporter substrate-binding protein [Ideonella azotifigens]